MALQMNLTEAQTSTGVPAPEAYCRIVELHFNTKIGLVQLWVETHFNQAARDAGKNPISGARYDGTVGVNMPSIDDSIPGVRAALYSWLKTLPDFSGAVDV